METDTSPVSSVETAAPAVADVVPTTPVEVVPAHDPGLVVAIQKFPIAEASRVELLKSFGGFALTARTWLERAKTVNVTDATQVREMSIAREIRLGLKQTRVAANKLKDGLKAETLAYGRAVDSLFNELASRIEPVEEQLQKAEDFAKLAEEKRVKELTASRRAQLEPLVVDKFSLDAYNLGVMSDGSFAELLAGLQAAADQRKREAEEALEAQRKREAEAIEAKRRADLEKVRMQEVLPLMEPGSRVEVDLGAMDDTAFAALLSHLRAARKAKEEKLQRAMEHVKELWEVGGPSYSVPSVEEVLSYSDEVYASELAHAREVREIADAKKKAEEDAAAELRRKMELGTARRDELLVFRIKANQVISVAALAELSDAEWADVLATAKREFEAYQAEQKRLADEEAEAKRKRDLGHSRFLMLSGTGMVVPLSMAQLSELSEEEVEVEFQKLKAARVAYDKETAEREARQKAEADALAERNRLAAASDAEKLAAYADALAAVEKPTLTSGHVGAVVVGEVDGLVQWVRDQARSLRS